MENEAKKSLFTFVVGFLVLLFLPVSILIGMGVCLWEELT